MRSFLPTSVLGVPIVGRNQYGCATPGGATLDKEGPWGGGGGLAWLCQNSRALPPPPPPGAITRRARPYRYIYTAKVRHGGHQLQIPRPVTHGRCHSEGHRVPGVGPAHRHHEHGQQHDLKRAAAQGRGLAQLLHRRGHEADGAVQARVTHAPVTRQKPCDPSQWGGGGDPLGLTPPSTVCWRPLRGGGGSASRDPWSLPPPRDPPQKGTCPSGAQYRTCVAGEMAVLNGPLQCKL